MSDRLAELRRQRALLTEHVAWLDREIAAEEARITEPVAAPPAAERRSAASVSTASGISIDAPATIVAPVVAAPQLPRAAAADAEAILDQYRVGPDTMRTDVRKGCFLYFALALLLLGAGVAILWFVFRHR